MRQALLLELVGRPRVKREVESKKVIQRIIQIEELQGGWRFIFQVLVKIIDVSMTKVAATAEGSLVGRKINKTSKMQS